MAVDPELLAILACPRCKGSLKTLAEPGGLLCSGCRLEYPVNDGIPVMVPEEARPWAVPDGDEGKGP